MSGTTKSLITARKVCIDKALSEDPKVPTMTLAKKLVKSDGELFQSVEVARSCVRRVRGENGTENRKHHKNVGGKRRVNTPIGNIVPPSDSQPQITTPVNLKLKGHGTIISDLHMPYHSEEAVEAALEHSYKNNKMDWILINGDLIDFYQASRWNRNPKARDVEGEIGIAREFLVGLTKHYKRVILKVANHEARLDNYVYANAPVLAGLRCLTLPELLGTEEHGIQFVGAQQIMHVGKHLTILHGHELASSANNPVNPARGVFMRAKDNAIISHHHKPSEHVENTIRGKVISTFSLGCLCDLRPPYAPVNGYVHGFANMYVEGNDFEVDNYRITDKFKVR